MLSVLCLEIFIATDRGTPARSIILTAEHLLIPPGMNPFILILIRLDVFVVEPPYPVCQEIGAGAAVQSRVGGDLANS